MKSSSWLWRILGLTTFICLLIMVTGFAWALKDTWFPKDGLSLPEASKPEVATGGNWSDKAELYVTSLGDSLTKGTGDSTGEGYVARVVDRLSKEMDKPVYLVNNLAINGLRADLLVKRLDESGYKNSIGKADIILMTIGGNDLFRIAQNGGSMAEGGDLSPKLLLERMPEAKPSLETVFHKVRKLNPTARIIYVGLYNAFYDLPAMRPASEVVAKWNEFAHDLAEADGNATVVPTYDLFEFNLKQYLSSDHFHPNALGYDRISERIVQALH
ncbi:GDSL-type esterase/lipase family protein [Cohnella silvisoli]|uniref:GDSL-type esterase/lipase family protein n=1 Tax=Cohnella silvisoli TaxID=2873699 RepID=A0ABV1KP48_9BACL|nr:GDSL-type esterase/lipase family protein [Cohnella silvisoli]MCD9021088.1 GDSL family lipase [Cohnella silvisoli]